MINIDDKNFQIESYFCKGQKPDHDIEWVKKDTEVLNKDGEVLFELKNVEYPETWSQQAVNIVSEKYFAPEGRAQKQETSLKELVHRVCHTIRDWGVEQSYFGSEQGDVFYDELSYMLYHQYMAFNSPVFFNLGLEESPMISACFIQGVEDSMESIMELVANEAKIFQSGGGSGSNLSALRSSIEPLSKGGIASGPVSFMKGFDAFAGVIKSGGRLRRAAKMVILNGDHPDIDEFIWCKAAEEKRLQNLMEGGETSFDDVYQNTNFQNGNNSVRLTDAFFKAFEKDGNWYTKEVLTGKKVKKYKASELLHQIAEAAHICGDPGLQFHTTVNRWNTIANSGKIISSNPCFSKNNCLMTDQGLKRIDTLVGEKFKILNGDHSFSEATAFKTGTKDVYRITLSSGQRLEVTKDHRLLSSIKPNCFIEAKDIGEKVVPAEVKEIRWSGDSIDPGFAVVLGFSLGDSSPRREQVKNNEVYATHNARIYLRQDGDDNVIGGIFKEYFSDYHSVDELDGRKAISSSDFSAIWSEYIDGYYVSERSMKDTLMSLDPKSMGLMLKGLFSANGSVLEQYRRIALKSTSRVLLSQVQMMLSMFGIRSYISTNKEKKNDFANGTYTCKESYDLNISAHWVPKFAEYIGFVQSSKMDKLLSVLKSVKDKPQSKFILPTIKTVEYLGEMEVFDFTESKTHIGGVNGVFAHNCSEFMSLDNSACNLASLNLIKFVDFDKEQFFDIDSFKHAIQLTILAQEILIDKASYPTEKISNGAKTYRQLGLGYSNLGGMLMALGYPYDSDYARSISAAVTSFMTSTAYDFSADLAAIKEPFSEWDINKDVFLKVLGKHLRAHKKILNEDSIEPLLEASLDTWGSAINKASKAGMRNSQVTLLAPTGTIGFMMDVATTGVEPDLSLVKTKSVVGGGVMHLVNPMVGFALDRLDYDEKDKREILNYILENHCIDGAPHFNIKHAPIFDCAIPIKDRSIAPMGHVQMMAAVQPFLSSAISKTVNLSSDSTVKDIEDIYYQSWKLGLKSVAVYRNGSKIFQPLKAKSDSKPSQLKNPPAVRKSMSNDIQTIRHKFNIAGNKGYLHVGLFEEGKPGELFIRMAKAGSTINGLMDCFGIAVSLGLQYGVPLEAFSAKFINTRFEPEGWTKSDDIRFAKSLLDYIFRWMDLYFKKGSVSPLIEPPKDQKESILESQELKSTSEFDGPPCPSCGYLTVINGTCHRCPNCGITLGCS